MKRNILAAVALTAVATFGLSACSMSPAEEETSASFRPPERGPEISEVR